MMKKVLLVSFVLCSIAAWGQIGCEFSNTGPDGGIASVNAATGQGFSAPGGIGAVGFRLPTSCILTNISFHVWQVDGAPAVSAKTYDVGIYCVVGDCDGGGANAGKLYAHIGAVYGTWFTNNRIAATYTGVTAVGTTGILTLTGSFNLQDFPVGVKVTLSACGSFNGTSTVNASPAPATGSIDVAKTNSGGTVTGCTIVASAGYPTQFSSTSVCPNANFADPCQEAFRIVVDARTICTSIPCTLPSGIYAAAWGTDCSSATATNCAQLFGDDDSGAIYPFIASCAAGCSPGYDSVGGLPASMTFTRSNTTTKWNTTPGSSAPVKPVKLLFY